MVDREVQPLLGARVLAEQSDAGRHHHRGDRTHGMAVIGEDVDAGMVDHMRGDLFEGRVTSASRTSARSSSLSSSCSQS